jgi:CheY-like chemotaxis protein
MTTSPATRSARKSILFIDDDEGMRAAIYHTFSPEYRVTMAANGIDGYAKAIEHPGPDVIITDIAVSLADGLTMVRRIHENEDLRQVPIIFLTGQTSSMDLIAGLPIGIPFAQVPRSSHPYVLKKKVESALAAL